MHLKPLILLVLAAFWLAVCSPAGGDPATPSSPGAGDFDTGRMGEQVREISKEMTRVFIQKLQGFLDQELERLRRESPPTRAALEAELKHFEEHLENHPHDPQAHFALGEVYDQLGRGAEAILHMRHAEARYKEEEDMKGLAESRRNLRNYFSKYDFKPQDFDLTH
ncbi:MAG: hypothetical protein ACE5ER_12980 [Nitrospinaceae bacterium]